MLSTSDEEIRNLFFFLADENPSSNKEKLKITDLIYGLENYGLPLSNDSLRMIKNQIEKNSQDGFLLYEEFKILWMNNIDNKSLNVKELTNQMYNMMIELINEDNTSVDLKIDKFMLNKLIHLLEINTVKDEENEDAHDKKLSLAATRDFKQRPSMVRRSITKDKFKSTPDALYDQNEMEVIVKEMIHSIDTDNDEMVSIKDFEFLITEYLNRFKNNN